MSKKMIVIPHQGPIYPKGGIHGPITTPFMEDLTVINTLLFGNYKVAEVLADGTQVPLSLSNFDKDNTPKKVEAKKVAPVETAPAAPATETAPKQTQQQQAPQQQSKQQKRQQQADSVEKK